MVKTITTTAELAFLGNSTKEARLTTATFPATGTPALIFARGHLKDVDPGAVFYQGGKIVRTETDLIELAFTAIASLFVANGLSFNFVLRGFLNVVIDAVNKIFTKSKSYLAVSIHSDMALDPSKFGPVIGIYYTSEEGLDAANAIVAEIKDVALSRGAPINTWIRHDSKARMKSLGWLRFTKHNAILVELDIVSAGDTRATYVRDVFATSMLNLYAGKRKKKI